MSTEPIRSLFSEEIELSEDEDIEELIDQLVTDAANKDTWIPVRGASNGAEGWYLPAVDVIVERRPFYKKRAALDGLGNSFGLVKTFFSTDDAGRYFSRAAVPKEFDEAVRGSSSYLGVHYIDCNYTSECFAYENGSSKRYLPQSEYLFIPMGKMPESEFYDGVELGSILLTGDSDLEKKIRRLQGDTSLGMTDDLKQTLMEKLLETDLDRYGAEAYEENLLTDPSRGHWELWKHREAKESTDRETVQLPDGEVWYARNPVEDAKRDTVGIDFGTKSTIVCYSGKSGQIKFHRIGTGKTGKQTETSDYENPTFMEFIDYEQFHEDYDSADGRPHTYHSDLLVSHSAANEFKTSEEQAKIYSFFYDIKQWCSESRRSVSMRDQQNKDLTLKPFLNCEEGDFNPLELYAYYLGLHINNLRSGDDRNGGVYLNYNLSFPVSFPKEVREKMLMSFRRGLMKSFPQEILDDDACMADFKVDYGISEPAAYAITALTQYGFRPKKAEDKVCYAVFDFGGGTSDFDFGICRPPKSENREERAKSFVIEHFNQASDSRLGGENLLEMLAYDIFKANQKLMRENGFPFQRPVDEDSFPGEETVINDSKEARRNMKNLSERLRPLWEGILGRYEAGEEPAENKKSCEDAVPEEDGSLADVTDAGEGAESVKCENTRKPITELNIDGWKVRKPSDEQSDVITEIQSGFIKVTLYNKEGEPKAVDLKVKDQESGIELKLVNLLKERIQSGAHQFFEAFSRAKINVAQFRHPENLYYVFFAGNSSRSPLLKYCMEEELDRYYEALNLSEGERPKFVFVPPLGTAEAERYRKENGLPEINQDEWAPTGKTGVAYGLILGRKGGKVVVKEIGQKDLRFKYHLGSEQNSEEEDGLFCVHSQLVRDSIEIGKWVNFSEDHCEHQVFYPANAGDEVFEIYYSDLPSAATDRNLKVEAKGVYRISCKIANPDIDANIWIRCVGNDEIEYCLSKREEGPNEEDAKAAVKVSLGQN